MKLPRPRLTYANVVSTLCLFILLGGSAYAAIQLPKNSVGTKHLRDNAVTRAKLSSGVRKALRATAASPAPGKGQRGPVGKTGKIGKTGATGPVGPTEGFASGNFLPAPPQALEKEDFSFAQAGRPFVFSGGQARVYCSDTGSEVETGLFVDGAAVTGSGELIPSEQMVRLSLFGLGPKIAAGKHTIAIGFSCINGGVADLENVNEPNFGAILLGG